MGRITSLGLAVLFVCASASAASPFDGTWASNCYNQGAQGQNEYGISTLDITDTTMTGDTAIYTDTACATQSIATIQEGADLSLSTDSNAPAGAEAANTTLSTLNLTFNAQEYVDYMNSTAFCGYTNWAVNVAQDVLGKNCGGQQMPASGTVEYNIMGIGTDGKLYMGLLTSTLNGTSDATRPTSLDSSVGYAKTTSSLFWSGF